MQPMIHVCVVLQSNGKKFTLAKEWDSIDEAYEGMDDFLAHIKTCEDYLEPLSEPGWFRRLMRSWT